MKTAKILFISFVLLSVVKAFVVPEKAQNKVHSNSYIFTPISKL